MYKRQVLQRRPTAGKPLARLIEQCLQKHPDDRLTYTVTGESGPAHDKRFQVTVALNGKALAVGEGRSKKAAEQQAAKAALTKLEQQA